MRMGRRIGGVMTGLRAQARDLARLLLFAFALQLITPLAGATPVMRVDDGGALICVASRDGDSAPAAGDDADHAHGLVECVFCLPLIGAAATPPTPPPHVPAPSVTPAPTLAAPDAPRHVQGVAAAAPPRAPPVV